MPGNMPEDVGNVPRAKSHSSGRHRQHAAATSHSSGARRTTPRTATAPEKAFRVGVPSSTRFAYRWLPASREPVKRNTGLDLRWVCGCNREQRAATDERRTEAVNDIETPRVK